MTEINTEYIQNITNQINGINSFLDISTSGLENSSQAVIDQRIEKLEGFLSLELNKTRQSIIDFMRSQYATILIQIEVLRPLVEGINLTDLSSVIAWINNLITFFTGGYQKLLALQLELLAAIIPLSNAIIAASSHNFPNLPGQPSINVQIDPITTEDITG